MIEINYVRIYMKINHIFFVIKGQFPVTDYTVELRWLELVGTVGASSTHPCVRAIPSLTIFKLVHVYFMSSRTGRFFIDKSCKAHVTPVIDQ